MSITELMKEFEDIEKEIDKKISKKEFEKAWNIIDKKIKESYDRKLISFLLYKKAEVEFYMGKQEDAMRDISRSLGILEDIEDRDFKGEIMFHLGRIFAFMGDLENSEKIYKKVVEIFPESNYFYLASISNLGDIYKRLEKMDISLKYFERAYKNSIKNEMWRISTYAAGNIGELYALKGDKENAREWVKKALELSKKFDEKRIRHALNLSIGIIEGDVKKIEEYSQKLKEMNYTHDVAEVYYVFSNVANEKIRDKLLREAIFIYSELGDKYMEREAIKKLEGNN